MSRRGEVRLRTALQSTSSLRPHVANGLGACKSADRALIAANDRKRVGDSLDLDAAMRADYPQHNRWDYLISVPDRNDIVGLEPHTARDDQISVVIDKKRQALQQLRGHFADGHRVGRWVWLSGGAVGFAVMDKARRRLNMAGIDLGGRYLRLE